MLTACFGTQFFSAEMGKDCEKMKKLLSFLLVLAVTASLSVGAFAASDAAGKNAGKENGKSDLQKQFKAELNELKKQHIREKSALEKQKEALEAKYQELLAAGDTAGAQTALADLDALDLQIAALRVEIKKTADERFMIVKTQYSDEELAQFDSAAALIEKMTADATALGAGSVIVKNNLIKFDAPPYIKGGKTLVPVRAISEALGAQVTWDEATQTVSIKKDDTVVVMTPGSATVFVNGLPVTMDAPAEKTCSRTYVPLRFLAETFGLDVTWDGDNDTIDIDEDAEESAEITPDEPAADGAALTAGDQADGTAGD